MKAATKVRLKKICDASLASSFTLPPQSPALERLLVKRERRGKHIHHHQDPNEHELSMSIVDQRNRTMVCLVIIYCSWKLGVRQCATSETFFRILPGFKMDPRLVCDHVWCLMRGEIPSPMDVVPQHSQKPKALPCLRHSATLTTKILPWIQIILIDQYPRNVSV